MDTVSAYEAELERIRPRLAPLLPRTVVALDFDGVLAPIVERPEDARALPAASQVLSAVAERVARVAIVTGRPALDAVRFSGLGELPGLESRMARVPATTTRSTMSVGHSRKLQGVPVRSLKSRL
jgi:hypothetical protein